MPSGLVALLDDIAGITKLAAASLDDVGAAASKAGSKAIGVVVDDTAVTPRYVVGLAPQRELPIIWKIARGSLFNKLVILLPAALLLSSFAPWAITPILMLGGAYLSFEGAEKLLEAFGGDAQGEGEEEVYDDPARLEESKVSGAVRTDLILSAEIMAIALADVADSPLLMRGIVLALVGIAITAGVYGVVGLIVKMDDIGLHLAERRAAAVRALGRGMVKAMPVVMAFLATVGTAAMIWVGGGILVHGLEVLGFAAPAHFIHHLAEEAGRAVGSLAPLASWLVTAIGSGLVGLAVGMVLALLLHQIHKLRHKATASH